MDAKRIKMKTIFFNLFYYYYYYYSSGGFPIRCKRLIVLKKKKKKQWLNENNQMRLGRYFLIFSDPQSQFILCNVILCFYDFYEKLKQIILYA